MVDLPHRAPHKLKLTLTACITLTLTPTSVFTLKFKALHCGNISFCPYKKVSPHSVTVKIDLHPNYICNTCPYTHMHTHKKASSPGLILK